MRSSSGAICIAASAQKLDVDNRISLRYYHRIADNLLKQADIFREEKNVTDLYIMLLRFSSLIAETIPYHQDYQVLLLRERNSYKKKLLNALTELEALKPLVQKWLEELNRKCTHQVNREDRVHQNFSVDSSLEWPPTKNQTPTIYDTRQIRLMFTYAEDQHAKVSLIQGILKNNQEHALPAEIPRDLILEAKVRCGKRFDLHKSPLIVPPKPSAHDPCDPLQVEEEFESSLTSAVLRMEKEIGKIHSDEDSLGVQQKLDHLNGKEDPSEKSKMLMESSGQATKWSAFFTTSSNNSRDLKHYQRPSDDPDVHVEFDEGDTLAANLNWGNALVGYFIGNSPPFFAIKSSLEKAWRVKDLKIITMSEGFYLIKFHNYDIGQAILDDGPWFVHGHPLVLRRWTEDIMMYKQTFETIPVWVRFPNLNFCFRTNSALSKIASVIGTPICMDHATATGTRFAFARVCIEVGIDAELPSEIRMKYKGKTILQKVEYAWKPNPCRTCHTFDHGDKACPLKSDSSRPKQIWVPKKIQSGNSMNVDIQGPVEGLVTHNVPDGGWNVVKEKKSVAKQSPTKVLSRSASPTKDGSSTSPDQVNRFSSLSN